MNVKASVRLARERIKDLSMRCASLDDQEVRAPLVCSSIRTCMRCVYASVTIRKRRSSFVCFCKAGTILYAQNANLKIILHCRNAAHFFAICITDNG